MILLAAWLTVSSGAFSFPSKAVEGSKRGLLPGFITTKTNPGFLWSSVESLDRTFLWEAEEVGF